MDCGSVQSPVTIHLTKDSLLVQKLKKLCNLLKLIKFNEEITVFTNIKYYIRFQNNWFYKH